VVHGRTDILVEMRKSTRRFNAQTFLDSAGLSNTVIDYRRAEVIFSQGDRSDCVMYIQQGGVKVSVLSKAGREAVVAMLGPGDFFGEGCLAGQHLRIGSATAITPSSILVIERQRMMTLLREQPALSNRFISHMLSRNARIEADLIDQLLNSSEKPLADMVGNTRARVNVFLYKFRKWGSSNMTAISTPEPRSTARCSASCCATEAPGENTPPEKAAMQTPW
jgi:CRP/FNR family transcriptional regulator, cyclic AMP receptor protein